MANDLIEPGDLVGLPGAPFTEAEVDAAAASLRALARWHVAPVRAETVTLDVVAGDPVLRLPTRRLVSVAAVRDARTGTVVPATRYRVSRERGRVRKSSGSWPSGYEAVEVDMTHGFEDFPLDLLPLVSALALQSRRDPGVRSVQVDDASVTYSATSADSRSVGGVMGARSILARYVLPEWPGMA